jgi:hypothetical protein
MVVKKFSRTVHRRTQKNTYKEHSRIFRVLPSPSVNAGAYYDFHYNGTYTRLTPSPKSFEALARLLMRIR